MGQTTSKKTKPESSPKENENVMPAPSQVKVKDVVKVEQNEVVEVEPLGLVKAMKGSTILEEILNFLDTSPKLMLVCQDFRRIIGHRRQEQLDSDYMAMKALGKKIYERLQFVEKFTIHRSSPLVNNLRVVDIEEVGEEKASDLKLVTEDDILEGGRIIPLRQQQQLSNFAEQWRATGTDSEKTEIFDMVFDNMWDNFNMKRWLGREDIIWMDENAENVSSTVKTLFDTLRDVRSNLDAYKTLMGKCMWHILAQEHAAALAFEKEKKEARKARERDQERKQKAGAFILDYRR
mmetsp:Transcript_3401/g.4611  ORF Transcript_3401/g.4611 Transcript_3401/m.4611 type:complete len:292 (-) Transcript_3401:338-1213(-)